MKYKPSQYLLGKLVFDYVKERVMYRAVLDGETIWFTQEQLEFMGGILNDPIDKSSGFMLPAEPVKGFVRSNQCTCEKCGEREECDCEKKDGNWKMIAINSEGKCVKCGRQIDQPKEKKIDDSINVRYEEDVVEAFNKFIKKWCGKWYPHLIDDDENDGQFMREKIMALVQPKEEKIEKLGKMMFPGSLDSIEDAVMELIKNYNRMTEIINKLNGNCPCKPKEEKIDMPHRPNSNPSTAESMNYVGDCILYLSNKLNKGDN